MTALNRNSSMQSSTPGATALSFYKHQTSHTSNNAKENKKEAAITVDQILDQPNDELIAIQNLKIPTEQNLNGSILGNIQNFKLKMYHNKKVNT